MCKKQEIQTLQYDFASSQTSSDVTRGLAAGFLRYLAKPFLIADLMDALVLALSHKNDPDPSESPVDVAATS